MKKVLITGGLGFIGSHLAKECVKRSYDVTVISKSKDKIKNVEEIKELVSIIIKDVRDIHDEVRDKDYIFHLAGSINNYAIIEDDPYRDIRLNCIGTIALLEACKKYNPKARIIFSSTFFVNGQPKKLPVTPESECSPLGLYGATRLAAEHFCHIYHNVFDLNIIIARFTNVFGPFEQFDNKKKAGFTYLINLALKGKELPVYNGGNFYRDFIYVADVVDACLILAEKGKINEIYYVGRGEFVKFKQLIDIVVNITGAKIKDVEPPDFHKRVGIRDFVCDNTLLKKLGWKPKVSLEEGIKLTMDYCKSRGV